MSIVVTGKNYIGGELSREGEVTYKTFDPEKNTENDAVFYEATRAEIERAVKKAVAAYEEYRSFSGKKKADFLEGIAAELESRKADLVTMYKRESGLPEGRAQGELGRTCHQLRAFSDLLRRGSWVEATISKTEGKADIRSMLVPIGPVAVFGASNFPFAFSTAGGDTASALAAGVPVVLKSHPMHAGTAELVSGAIIAAATKNGIPDGVFSNLNSRDKTVGEILVQHPDIKAVGFTGSFRGGMALHKLAGQRKEPIPVYAEMGSINPVVVLPSALESDQWAGQLAQSITLGSGQFCTNPGLILGIEGEALGRFTQALGTAIKDIQPGTMLHPAIREQYDTASATVLEQEGFTEIASFEGEGSANCGKQRVISVSGETFLANKAFHQEVFGPFSVVVGCKDAEELDRVVRELEGQLTGTVLCGDTRELTTYSGIVANLKEKVGRLLFNGVPTGVEVCAAMVHGGPYPATSNSKYTSVGLGAIKRWVRPVSFQDWPDQALPEELQDENPLGILREINHEFTTNPV